MEAKEVDLFLPELSDRPWGGIRWVDGGGNHTGDGKLKFGYEKSPPACAEKYLPEMNLTFDELVTAYSVEICVKPIKIRGA